MAVATGNSPVVLYTMLHPQFCEEFDSIVENCVKYNGSDSPFTEKVLRLKVKFYELVQIYLTPDIGANSSLSPLAAEVEGDSECLSSENPSSDEELNSITESQSTFKYDSQHDRGVGDLLEPLQTEEDLPHHEWKEKSNEDTIPRAQGPDAKAVGEMSAFEGADEVQDSAHHHDRLEETAGGTSQLSIDSDSELPEIKW
jgi:hypothetical protein